MKILRDLLFAFQFLTRIPVASPRYEAGRLARSTAFFPIVGLIVALGGIGIKWLVFARVPVVVFTWVLLAYLILVTGGLHEDGLGDVADAFGGAWNKEKILAIMRDSRIGSFGGLAISLSVLGRFVLLSNLPPNRFVTYLIAAQVLCRWTTLPLSLVLKPARDGEGQGARVAGRIPAASFLAGTIFAFGICIYVLRSLAWLPIIVAATTALVTGLYYWRQIGGVTGDCFGATNQLAEVAIYFCGILN